MELQKALIIIGIIAQIISMLVIFAKISYGQGRAKEREENFTETVKTINRSIENTNIKLDNHITHISDDISSIKERISKIEGRINGKN